MKENLKDYKGLKEKNLKEAKVKVTDPTWSQNWLFPETIVGFPGASVVKASACNAGDLGSIPGLGRS